MRESLYAQFKCNVFGDCHQPVRYIFFNKEDGILYRCGEHIKGIGLRYREITPNEAIILEILAS
jgi:hypothetical protein